jgi:hypothetical protein
MPKQKTRQRPIDQSISRASQSLSSRFVLASKTEIKAWKAFVIVMFAVGFAAALVWSAYNGWYVGSDAKTKNKKTSASDFSDSDKKDLAAYWSFDEDDNKTAHDKSGNGNDGKMYDIKKTQGKSKEAFAFNGTSAFVKIPGSTGGQPYAIGDGHRSTPVKSLDITEKITLEAWIFPEDDKNQGAYLDGIITKGGLFDKEASYQLYFNPRSSKVVGVIRYGKEKKDYALISRAAEMNKWSHVALTLDEKGNVDLWVNGTPAESKELPKGKKMQSSGLDINIGGAYPNKYETRYFHGKIDEVRIYSRALSEAEIKRHAGISSSGLKNLIFYPAGAKADQKEYKDLTDSLFKEVEGSPYDSFTIELVNKSNDSVPSFAELSGNLAAVKRSGKFVWPRIYFNRLVGCCEAPACLATVDCKNREALKACYKEKSLDTGYNCTDSGFYCKNVCESEKSLSDYYSRIKEEGKYMDLWDQAGALSDFYKLLETSLKLARESGAPGIFIDHELYYNYRMNGINQIVKVNGGNTSDTIARLEEIGRKIADIVNDVYPDAVLLSTSADFSLKTGDYGRSTNYILEGILKRAKKKNYKLKLVEGGEKSIWYLHSALDAPGVQGTMGAGGLKQRLDEQEKNMKSYLEKYPKNFVLGGTHGLYLDWKDTKGNWNDWATDMNGKGKLEVKKAADFGPLLEYLFKKREYVWFFSGAPSSKGYNEFGYSKDPNYISQFRDIVKPLFCGNKSCEKNRGENEKNCPSDCAKEKEDDSESTSEDL